MSSSRLGVFTRIRTVVRELTGRNDHILIRHLLGQLDATSGGVQLAQAVSRGEVPSAAAREEMVRIEHRGDEQRRNLIVELSSALAPLMDREDLFRLSRSVDDVLDNLRDLVREMDLFGIAREPLLDDLLDGVADGIAALRRGIQALVEESGDSRVGALAAKKNDIRRRYQQATARLLAANEPVTGLVMKRRELLRRVDVIGLRLGEAADALVDGTIKRSH